MTWTGTNATSLAQLEAPRRNRYFYGKLLDVLHLSMEQQYGIAASANLNRLNFGPGVLCGLEVESIERDGEHGVRVAAGVAIDYIGRRIVVPDAVELLPLELTDDCGMPARPQADRLPESLVLSICYRQCEADFAPALVADSVCNGSLRCEAGTWVESYSLIVREGDATPISHACREETMDSLKAGDVQAALCALATECPDVPAETCVPLAAIAVDDDGSLSIIDPCAYRPVVPTNRLLLELIACLAQRVEECCGSGEPDPDPGPTPAATFKIDDLVVGNRAGTAYHKLSGVPPGGEMTMPYAEESGVIDVLFSGVVDEGSVVLGTNVEVVDAAGATPAFDPPTFPDGGKRMRLELSAGTTFDRSTYTVSVSGDQPTPIRSDAGIALDAELTQLSTGEYKLPTGDDAPGGVFSTTFTVK